MGVGFFLCWLPGRCACGGRACRQSVSFLYGWTQVNVRLRVAAVEGVGGWRVGSLEGGVVSNRMLNEAGNGGAWILHMRCARNLVTLVLPEA
jgi:hypothetical protein